MLWLWSLAALAADPTGGPCWGAGLAVPVGGGGEFRFASDEGEDDDEDWDDPSGAAVLGSWTSECGGEGGWGIGARYTPGFEVDPDWDGDFDFGALLEPMFVAEYVPSKAGDWPVILSGQAGPLLILPDDDLEDVQEAVDDEGMKVGLHVGAGAGSAWTTDRIAVRGTLGTTWRLATLAEDDDGTFSFSGLTWWLAAEARFRPPPKGTPTRR